MTLMTNDLNDRMVDFWSWIPYWFSWLLLLRFVDYYSWFCWRFSAVSRCCFVRVVEWRYAAIRKRLCDYSRGAMRIVGRREADFMHLWAFVWGCLVVVGKWLFIPVKKWLNAWLLREKWVYLHVNKYIVVSFAKWCCSDSEKNKIR